MVLTFKDLYIPKIWAVSEIVWWVFIDCDEFVSSLVGWVSSSQVIRFHHVLQPNVICGFCLMAKICTFGKEKLYCVGSAQGHSTRTTRLILTVIHNVSLTSVIWTTLTLSVTPLGSFKQLALIRTSCYVNSVRYICTIYLGFYLFKTSATSTLPE